MEDLPIDIHYNKLLDWLIKRRHCKQNWQDSILKVRELINNAIQDMPAHDGITTLLSGTYINYFHCLKIIDVLKETEASSRNIFGSYSSQRMKDWQQVIKLYQEDSVYLAEAAQMLTRNVNFEVPALKKLVSKCKKTQQDCTRKESDYKSLVVEYRKKYTDACKNIGIEGKSIKRELLLLASDLPDTFTLITDKCKLFKDSLDYYKRFSTFLHQSAEDVLFCPLLNTIIKKGNITTYEWRTGVAPSSIEEMNLVIPAEKQEEISQEEGEIDWGAIDFGDDAGGDNEGVIDFGDDDVEIEIAGEGILEMSIGNTTHQSSSNTSATDQVAQGSDALTVLDNPSTRFIFMDELNELQSFLAQRLVDMTGESDVIVMSIMQSASADLQINEKSLQTWITAVKEVNSEISSAKMQQLMSIRNSPRYVDRMTETITKIMDQSEKMAASARLMVIRQQEALDEELATEPKITLIKQKTMELKKQVEGEISLKYKNRLVNIMGEINMM